jgi:hypothetical protein
LFTESIVLPICSFRLDKNKEAVYHKFYGSSFIFGDDGTMMTAAHVLREAIADAEDPDINIGVVGTPSGNQAGSIISIIKEWDFAPQPSDIAVFRSAYRSNTNFRLSPVSERNSNYWTDVNTIGFPGNLVTTIGELKTLRLRASKGYIRRMVYSGDLMHPTPTAYELSFQIDKGMSGSPLFIRRSTFGEVVGICVSSIRSEYIYDRYTKIQEDGSTYSETTVKIEEFGIAHSFSDIVDWVPAFRAQPLDITHAP